MKPKLLFLVFLLTTLTFAQQKLIAIKGTTTDAIATTLEEAINLAQPNDKIYLPGGNYALNDSIQKPVHIIGTGYNHLIPRATPITVFISELKIGSQASGTIIEGIKINSSVYINSNNIILKKMFFYENLFTNTTVSQISVNNSINISNYKNNIFILNCYLNGHISCGQNSNIQIYNSIFTSLTGSNNSIIKNCLIGSKEYSYGVYHSFYYASNLNVFNTLYHQNAINSSINFNNSTQILNNNFFINTNLVSTNPGGYHYDIIFTDPLVSDYHLTSLCPIQNIGIYFGDYPWKDGGQPINPHITENNSFLDVQNEQFKLRVKVIPQTN